MGEKQIVFRCILYLYCIIIAIAYVHVKHTTTVHYMGSNTLKLTSFNCRGAMASSAYVVNLLDRTDILCLQEHHLYPDAHGFLQTLDNRYHAFVRSDPSLSLTDRRRICKGGTAILCRKDLAYAVNFLDDMGNDRVMGISLTLRDQLPIFVFNVYMPSASLSLDEYRSMLDILIQTHEYYSIRGIVIFCGDMNGEMGSSAGARAPAEASVRGRLLYRLLDEYNMCSTVCMEQCTGPKHTYMSYDGNYATQIDHVLLDCGHVKCVESCSVDDEHVMNSSDHLPVCVTLCVNIPRISLNMRRVYKWAKADTNGYCTELSKLIQECELMQRDIQTENDIDEYTDAVIQCMIQASEHTVPMSKFSKHKKPYWDDDLTRLHNIQKSKRKIWIENGRPRGMEYQSYKDYKEAKRTFAKAHRVKMLLHEQKQYDNIDNAVDVDIRKFWRMVKAKKPAESINLVHQIQDENGNLFTTPEELLSMWKLHFQHLLNEQEKEKELYDNNFKVEVDNEIDEILANTSPADRDSTGTLDDPITPMEIQLACQNLPNGKAPGHDLLMYEHMKHGGQALYDKIAILFNAIIKHVHVPNSLKTGVIITLHKGKRKPKNKTGSYRGVTLMSAFNKLLEKIIWSRLQTWLDSVQFPSQIQHACQKNNNNVFLSFSLQEIIHHFTERGSKVFSCFLDCDKAFDRVWWNGLLLKLHRIGIRGKLWHLFKNWLEGSQGTVLLNGQFSDLFEITRSIKQGGILSMFFFVVSTYDLPEYVNRADGVKYYDKSVGTLSLADDSTLISLTKAGLDRMMKRAST